MINSLVVAASQNNVIGINNSLPWHLPNDLKYFKNLTWGMPIVMGRKTFESIGKPLPGRDNIVVTRNPQWKHAGVTAVASINEARQKAGLLSVKEIFIIGGAEIFKTVLPEADKIYLTCVHHDFEGDVFFPVLDEGNWELQSEHFCNADEKNLFNHSFQVWVKKQEPHFA